MAAWPLHEAKQKFSEVVDLALDQGPQIVTRYGKEVVVVVSAEEFRRLQGECPDFKRFLIGGPSTDGMDLNRRTGLPRDVKL